jgi:hypothetical protein
VFLVEAQVHKPRINVIVIEAHYIVTEIVMN